jgi:hypothetical protein
VRKLFKRLDNQHEILQKLGALLTQVDSRMDEMARKYEWQAQVLKRMDYTVGKINEGTTHVQSFAVRNDEKMNIVLKYRDHMLDIFTNQKKMNATLEEILGDRSAGPSSSGPAEPSSSLDRVYAAGTGGLWDSPEREVPDVGVATSEGAAGPEVASGQGDIAEPENVAAPEDVVPQAEVTAPQDVAAPEDTPPDLSAAQDSVAKPDVTMTSPTPINSQDEAQATTTLVAAPPPPPTSNPPETVVVTRQLSPLPTESTSSDTRLAPPPLINEKRAGKRSRENTPIPGDRRSPRIRANSRAPSPPKIGPPKRQSEAKGGGDSKRHKPNPS